MKIYYNGQRSRRAPGTEEGTEGERKSKNPPGRTTNEERAYNDALKKKQLEAASIDLRLSQAKTVKERSLAESDKDDFEKAIGMSIEKVLSLPFKGGE
tara:strand:- start:1661 stop:1954 length:294 start_codon:yes stop_codon:yes gene_type:complete